jgi:hypothetical protein
MTEATSHLHYSEKRIGGMTILTDVEGQLESDYIITLYSMILSAIWMAEIVARWRTSTIIHETTRYLQLQLSHSYSGIKHKK